MTRYRRSEDEDLGARPPGVPATIALPCGQTGLWDRGSGIGYRCDGCFAVVGSVGMPRYCRDLMDQERAKAR